MNIVERVEKIINEKKTKSNVTLSNTRQLKSLIFSLANEFVKKTESELAKSIIHSLDRKLDELEYENNFGGSFKLIHSDLRDGRVNLSVRLDLQQGSSVEQVTKVTPWIESERGTAASSNTTIAEFDEVQLLETTPGMISMEYSKKMADKIIERFIRS